MSTNNVTMCCGNSNEYHKACFYGELTKIILQLSSNTLHLHEAKQIETIMTFIKTMELRVRFVHGIFY